MIETTHRTGTEALFTDFRGRLLSFIGRRVGNKEDAEDILQDVFARIHENGARIDEIESVSGWVYRIARNAVIDHHRRRAAMERASHAIATETTTAIPEHEGDSKSELLRCLEPLLASLPERYRRALELTELSGLTQREAAERLGLSLSGVKSRVQRGRSKLRERLLDCCHVELDRRGSVIDYSSSQPGSCACRHS